jgi:hypothetical protein
VISGKSLKRRILLNHFTANLLTCQKNIFKALPYKKFVNEKNKVDSNKRNSATSKTVSCLTWTCGVEKIVEHLWNETTSTKIWGK